jgi:hypothetical protein
MCLVNRSLGGIGESVVPVREEANRIARHGDVCYWMLYTRRKMIIQ